MAITLETATRNAMAAAAAALVDAGAAEGKCEILTTASAVLLVSFELGDPAFGAPAAGVVTASGLPIQATAVGTGTAAVLRVVDSDDNIVWSGTAGGSGSGADAILDNASIETGQTCNLTSLTFTMPAS